MSSRNSRFLLSTPIFLALSAPFVFGAYFKLQPRIVGGMDAVRCQFPYSVSIRDYTRKIHFCGGAIISDRHILTAAHCLQENLSDARNLYVIVGAIFRDDEETAVKVANVSIHRHFNNETNKNDIAMLHTAEKLLFTDAVKPIALTNKPIRKDGVLSVVVNGFGRRWVCIHVLSE